MHEKNPWDVQVWHLFLTEWPHMKPDTEGTGSDMELLQVLWQPKKANFVWMWWSSGDLCCLSAQWVPGHVWLPVINAI